MFLLDFDMFQLFSMESFDTVSECLFLLLLCKSCKKSINTRYGGNIAESWHQVLQLHVKNCCSLGSKNKISTAKIESNATVRCAKVSYNHVVL